MEEGLIRNTGHEIPAEQYSPLTLAFMGDAVFEVFVRKMLVSDANKPVKKLHKQSSGFVKAKAQSRMIGEIKDELSEKEKAIYRRGRNAKSATSAKNATIREYRRSTGFEALLGYLYLDGQTQRLNELMKKAVAAEKKYSEKK